MRWRLENALGYKWTHALELMNERDQPLYDMIFATDHDAGNRIMASLYNSAESELSAMRQAAIERRRLLDEEARGVMRRLRQAPVPGGKFPFWSADGQLAADVAYHVKTRFP